MFLKKKHKGFSLLSGLNQWNGLGFKGIFDAKLFFVSKTPPYFRRKVGGGFKNQRRK
jgi:hypothetical protein